MATFQERFEARKKKIGEGEGLTFEEKFQARKKKFQERKRNVTLQAPPGELQLKQDRPVRQAISKFARPVLEFGGATAGVVAGLGAGAAIPTIGEEPALVLAGESLGFVAGRSAADFLDSLLGLPTSRNTRTAQETFADVPSDLIEGALISAGGQVVGKGLQLGFEKFFGPSKSFTAEKKELARLARENDIELTPADIIDTAPLRMFESLLDKIISSSGSLQKNHLATLEGITAMTERLKAKDAPAEVIEILGNRIIDASKRALKTRDDISSASLVKVKDRVLRLLGTRRNLIEVGERTRESLKVRSKKASQRVTDADSRFWESIRRDEEIPDNAAQGVAKKFLAEDAEVQLRSGPLRRLLKRIAKEPVDSLEELSQQTGLPVPTLQSLAPEDLKALLQDRGLIEEVPTALSFRLRLKELNQIIKEEDLAVKSGVPGFKGQSTNDGGIAKLVKGALKDDLREFSEPLGGEVLAKFNEFNAIAGRFKRLYGSDEMKRIIRADPATVIDTIISPTKINEWRVFKKASSQLEVEEMKSAFITKLIGVDDVIDHKAMASRIKRYSPSILNEVLGAKTLKQLKDVSLRSEAINKLNVSDPLFKTIVRRDPGQVFATIIKRSSNRNRSAVDSQNIARLDKLQAEGVLDEVGIERLRARYLEEIFAFNRQGRLPPQSIVKSIEDFGPRTKARLLTPDMVEDLEVISTISDVAVGAERTAGRPGGGAQNIISFSSIGMMLRHPVRNFPLLVLAPQTAAKIYTSKVGRKLLVEGFSTPVGAIRASELFTKLSAIALADGDIEDVQPPQELFNPIPQTFNPEATISQGR